MKKMQQIIGYGHHQGAHTNPVTFIPELEVKYQHNQPLIDKCMKAIVKEKMVGCLINVQRKKRQLEQNNSVIGNYSRLNGFLNGSIKRNRYQIQNPQSPSHLHLKTRHSAHHQSAVASLRQNISKLSTNFHTPSNTANPNSKQNCSVQKTLLNRYSDLKKNIQLSFISAIDPGEQQNEDKKNELYTKIKEDIKFPSIKKGKQNTQSNIIKSVLKRQKNYSIRSDFWKVVTNQQQYRQRVRRNSTSKGDINASNQKQVRSSLFKPSIPSSCRQNLLNYIDCLPGPFKRIVQYVLQFFEIRLPSQITAIYYSQILQYLHGADLRAWAIIACTFWDYDCDGIIKASDVFQVFKQFNQFDKKTNNQNIHEQYEQKPQTIQLRKIIIHNPNRNKQLISSTEDIVNVLKQYKIKQEIQSPIVDYSLFKTTMKSININSVSFLQSNQRAIHIFNQESFRLNQLLSCLSYEIVDLDQVLQPITYPISYLEEILIHTQGLNYKKVLPLLTAGDTKSAPNSNKIQPNPIQITGKSSSSYKQCFISTQHNEETRQTRQKIQEYKIEIKKKRQKQNKQVRMRAESEIKILKRINYSSLAESKMGQKIRQIVLLVLGLEEDKI